MTTAMIAGVANPPGWGPDALDEIRQARREHQDANAGRRAEWIRSNRYFYDRLQRTLRYIIEPHKRVLEIRCETGHLLASVKPSYGVGVEISDAMVESAREQHPDYHFVKCDPEDLELNETFDYIIFNHVFDTVDILSAMDRIRQHCTPETQVVVVNYNQLWQPIVEFASKIGLRSRFVEPNWVSENDIRGFLKLASFRPVRLHRFVLSPKWIPLLSGLMNGFVARLPGLRRLCLMQLMVARPVKEPLAEDEVTVSVVIPCRNEVGNVEHAVKRLPAMGKRTEILFCDDKSTDGTADEVRRMQALYPEKDIRLIAGPGVCKADNVWTGFRAARGDVLMILDADLTVMPEELPMFLRALVASRGDFINGSRLVYPMQHLAMKFANIIGNKFFGVVFSFLLQQRIKDTLCGTKVLWRKDWLRMEPNLGSWGIRDLWGDYELLFGASRLHLEIVEVPVHYQERIHGITKMNKVLSNGLRMLRICYHAWHRLEG
ncbi:MAG TPA: glycosyltransferase [Candidatus Saccharimonadales bacterium]|nr:glycosyltransferase [Candidatus Saccharimonadales bacterium]